jgi:hypothetical protein
MCLPRAEPSKFLQRIKLGSAALLAVLDGVMYTTILSLEISNNVTASDPHRILGHAVFVCAVSFSGICGLTIALFGCQECVLRLWGGPAN